MLDTIRAEKGKLHDRQDVVAVEEPLEIQLGSATAAGAAAKSVSITMRTPGNDDELALGFLFTEGIIPSLQQVRTIEHCGPVDDATGLQNRIRVIVDATVDVDLKKLERHFYTTSSCGVCGKASLDALHTSGIESLAEDKTVFSQGVLLNLPQTVRDKQAVFSETGGLHAAALFTPDGQLRCVREDVGRHNATDKVIGAVLREGADALPGHGMLVSGRASFELVQKALVAGVPLLAAVGAPSSLAVDTARRFDMTLVGFLRGGTFNVYAGKQRIHT